MCDGRSQRFRQPVQQLLGRGFVRRRIIPEKASSQVADTGRCPGAARPPSSTARGRRPPAFTPDHGPQLLRPTGRRRGGVVRSDCYSINQKAPLQSISRQRGQLFANKPDGPAPSDVFGNALRPVVIIKPLASKSRRDSGRACSWPPLSAVAPPGRRSFLFTRIHPTVVSSGGSWRSLGRTKLRIQVTGALERSGPPAFQRRHEVRRAVGEAQPCFTALGRQGVQSTRYRRPKHRLEITRVSRWAGNLRRGGGRSKQTWFHGRRQAYKPLVRAQGPSA